MSTARDLFAPGTDFAELLQRAASDIPEEWEQNKGAHVSRTDCASSIGIAVSLIEGMLATARVLWRMDLTSIEVQEALKDMRSCSELKSLLRTWMEFPQGQIREPLDSDI